MTLSDFPIVSFSVLRMNFRQTWGDTHYLGLTGLEILGEDFEPIDIDIQWMDVSGAIYQ